MQFTVRLLNIAKQDIVFAKRHKKLHRLVRLLDETMQFLTSPYWNHLLFRKVLDYYTVLHEATQINVVLSTIYSFLKKMSFCSWQTKWSSLFPINKNKTHFIDNTVFLFKKIPPCPAALWPGHIIKILQLTLGHRLSALSP